MQVNYIKNGANATKETMEQVRTAILWEKCDMLLALNQEGQDNQIAILRSTKATEIEKAAATEKLEKLQAEATAITEEQAEYTEAYNTVIENIKNSGSNFGENAIRSIFRLSVCDENSKFFKLAIINNDNTIFEQFYDNMVALHDMNNDGIDATGLRIYSKTAKETAKELSNKVQNLIRLLLSITVENDYTEKINIRFNKTDMNCVHETFVKDLSVKIANNKDKTVQGKEFKYAIRKVYNADGSVQYKGVCFMETLAKLAFVKLFKHSKIAEEYSSISNPATETYQRALSMNAENSYRIKLTKTTNTTPIITEFCNDEKYDFLILDADMSLPNYKTFSYIVIRANNIISGRQEHTPTITEIKSVSGKSINGVNIQRMQFLKEHILKAVKNIKNLKPNQIIPFSEPCPIGGQSTSNQDGYGWDWNWSYGELNSYTEGTYYGEMTGFNIIGIQINKSKYYF